MLENLLAICMITLICWSSGEWLLPRIDAASSQSFLLRCFTGLAAWGFVSLLLHLFLPLGTLLLTGLLFLPPLALLLFRTPVIRERWVTVLARAHATHPWLLVLSAVCLLLLLVMSSFLISHPDTLMYHRDLVRMAGSEALTPGVNTVEYHYGLQSSWFTLAALFRFPFLTGSALLYVNSTILAWLLAWIILTLDRQLKDRDAGGSLGSILLLAILFGSYTQFRLTATSASPDFPAAMMAWLCCWLMVRDLNSPAQQRTLVTLFACFAVTLKPSLLPLLGMPLGLVLFRSLHRPGVLLKEMVTTGVGMLLLLLPLFVVNYIATGWILFPLRLLDFWDPRWKTDEAGMQMNILYNQGYARFAIPYDEDIIRQTAAMPLTSWVPGWFSRQSIADKALLICSLLASLFLLTNARKAFRMLPGAGWLAALVCLIGAVLWFIFAPDPRFGSGFLVPLAGFAWILITKTRTTGNSKPLLTGRNTRVILGLLILLAGAYTFYRFIYFFGPSQWLSPMGVV